jgi:hypothetical protein
VEITESISSQGKTRKERLRLKRGNACSGPDQVALRDPIGYKLRGKTMTQPDAGAPSGTPDPNALSGGTVGDGSITPPDGGQSAVTPPAETPPAVVPQSEYEALKARLQAADRNRQAAQNELAQLRDKDMPEIARLQRDNQAAQEQIARQTAQIQEQAVELAFLRDNKVKWRDGAAALKLLDRANITVGEDGTVDGVKLAAEKLAKQYPFMVDDQTPPGGGTPPAGGGAAAPASAPPMNGRTSGENNGASGDMLKRLPALGSRRRPRS